MSNLKQVNIFPGRFQPFHKGHLKCCEDAYKKNGYPVVIMYVSNKKFDKKKPFDDSLLIKELEIVKKNYDFIEGFIPMGAPLIGRMCDSLKQNGYEANIWLAGPDRIDAYKKQLNPKYIDEIGVKLPELMETKRYSSATEVREAIKNDDKKKFIELMPDGTAKLYDEYKSQLDKIYESRKHMPLIEYINEAYGANETLSTLKAMENYLNYNCGGQALKLQRTVQLLMKKGLALEFIPYQAKQRNIKAWAIILGYQRSARAKDPIDNLPDIGKEYKWVEKDSINGERTMFQLTAANDFARQIIYGNKRYFVPEDIETILTKIEEQKFI